MNEKLLIVDDEEGIRFSLGEYFSRQGYQISLAEDGVKALERIKIDKPDVIILDVQLLSMDGLELCNIIRHQIGQAIGIIMISGVRRETIDKVVGLELGADVYITKPFETAELSAQVKALMRRLRVQNQPDSASLDFEDEYLHIDFKKRLVEAEGREVHLTKLEFDLLRYLVERRGVPISRSDLVDNVWGYEAGGDINDGAVNTAIAKLRAKFEPDLANPRYIQSVHGVGYRFKGI
jgi:two-component system, OmpR family, alkaline phosphatase synthesis response regulator PhoP